MSASGGSRIEGLARLFAHCDWADREIIAALRRSPRIPGKALVLLGHLLSAEKTWLMRLGGTDDGTVELWNSSPGLEECAALAATNADGYGKLLGTLEDSDLDEAVAYRNRSGEAFRTSVSDILTHVALHGSYHRGQIASCLRGEELEPVNTDYITFVRQGKK